MDHLTAPGLVAADRGCGQNAVTLRPKDAVCTFRLPDGTDLVLAYHELISEGERLRARVPPPRPRSVSYSFVYPSPVPGGRH